MALLNGTGTPLSLYEDPDNEFVAGFIGSPRMNFFDGVVDRWEGNQAWITVPRLGNIEVPVALGTAPRDGTRVTLGIRPKNFDPSHLIRTPLVIDVIENLGGVSYAYSITEGEDQPVVVEWRGKDRPVEGGSVDVGIDPNSVMLFDPASGLRLR